MEGGKAVLCCAVGFVGFVVRDLWLGCGEVCGLWNTALGWMWMRMGG